MLNLTSFGNDAAKPPLLIVHGLFGSKARNWGAIARRMGEDRRVVAVDMRNHAESAWTATHTYPDMAADLAEVVEAQGGPMDVLGHSMGGKASMQLALTRGDLVNRLVVADIAPVAYPHSRGGREALSGDAGDGPCGTDQPLGSGPAAQGCGAGRWNAGVPVAVAGPAGRSAALAAES